MDQNFKEYNSKNEEDHKSLFSENLSVKDQSSLYSSDCPKTPKALKDLNTITKEKLSALENAQRKWMEEMRNWSTTDEIQKAQLEWINKFSSFPTFSTINSPEKKKDTPWTMPFSPPRSSSDISRRRGYCVYEPGLKDKANRKVPENISEHSNDVKIAQLSEPVKVPIGCNATSKIVLSSTFSPFAESRSSKIDKSAKKRHITVRKKLQCQKKLELNEATKVQQNVEPVPHSKSASNTPDKSEEGRRAARKYIQRKRVERDRQLREQKEQEEKAEQEQRARLERLKETQHRILANSVKKLPKQQRKKEGWVGLAEKPPDEKPLSREMVNPPDYSGVHLTGAIPFLSSRGKKNTSTKDTKSSPRAPSIADIGWIQDENVPPPQNDGWESVPLDINEVKGAHLLSSRLSSPTKLSSSSGRPSSGSSIPEKLKDISLQKPSTPTLSASPVHSKLSSQDPSVIEVTPLVSEAEIFVGRSPITQSHPVIHDSDQPEKLEDDDLKKMLSFAPPLKKKDFSSSGENPALLYDNSYPLFRTSASFYSDSQYNMLAAISNKRSAFKDLENESLKKQQKRYSSFEIISQPIVSNNAYGYDKTNAEEKKVDEKGVQCQVDLEELRYVSSTSDQLGSINSNSEVKLTQSERLRKPNVILLPGRMSDPNVYSRRVISNNEVHIDTTVSENLTIDPLNISSKLSLVTRQNVDGSNDGSAYPFPEALSKGEHYDYHIVASDEQEQKNRFFDFKINSTSHKKTSHDHHFDGSMSETKKSDVSSAVFSQLQDIDVRRKIEAEVKRLDLFDDYIRTAHDKYNVGKNEENDDLSKLSFNEHLDITMKNYNMSDLSLMVSRDTSMAKSSSTKSSTPQSDIKWDIGVVNFAKFSLNMFIDLLKEESLRSKQQESHFKMRENSIVDKTKAEIAFLELEKKKFKLMGNEDGVRNVRKKIRGLIMKLQQNLEDLQLVRKMEKAAYRGRRRLLLEKIDLMKDQLKKQMESERKAKKDLAVGSSRSSIESSKEPIFSETLEGRMTGPIISETAKRDVDNEENRLSWKQKLEEGERRIKELEELIKHSPLGKDLKLGKTVERGTSPLLLSSDEERKKGDGSHSDTLDQLSTSSQHEKLENKDARKMIALKIPLSPRVTLKRRHSSGSDESLLLSQTETQSDASDMETRVLALQQQLKLRKSELESLHREYKKSQRERLIAKEQSLLSQIQAYDMYIGQVKKELEKENDGTEVKIVKPVIKHPKLICERRKSDTWLLQEKKYLKTSSKPISLSSSELVNNKEEVNKNQKDDKFLDNKALEKFTLKTDFINDVDNDRLHYDVQFASPLDSASEMIGSEEVDNERKTSLDSTVPHITEVCDGTRPLDTSNVNVPTSIKLVSQTDVDKSFAVSTIEEKIDFYEKLSENSSSSIETNVDAGSSISRTKKTPVKDITCRQDVQLNELRLPSTAFNSSDGEIASTLAKSESNLIPGTLENSYVTHEPMGIESCNSLVEKEESLEKTEQIKKVLDIRSHRNSDHFSLENNVIVGDVTSTIVSEIEENLSNNNIHEISSNKDSMSTHSFNKRTDHFNIIKEEDSIKDVSELLSEVPESFKSREESVVEEISELMSLSRVKDVSNDTVPNSKSIAMEDIFNEPVDNKEELSGYQVEEVEKSVHRSLFKKDSSNEDVVSSVNSEELSSSVSFPLPVIKNETVEASQLKENSLSEQTINVLDIRNDLHAVESESVKSEATLQEKAEATFLSSVAEEISHVQDIFNSEQIESEVEAGLSESASLEKNLSSVAEEVDSIKSLTEEVKTELSRDQEVRSDIEESLKQLITEQLNSLSSDCKSSQVRQSVSEENEEAFDLDRSISESVVDASLVDEQEDSLDEDINKVLMKTKLIEHDDGCESGNSFIDDKEMYNLINNDKREGGAGAPLIDALQREGDSAIDQVWRGIADAAVNDATDLVISTFFNKAAGVQKTGRNKLVGDSDDDEWDGEELHRQQAAEAEVLRLQQLRIDKEIEELEEEEARRYYYIRPIPDKPPPPYTPRRSSLVASVVEAAGEIWDGRTEAPSSFMAGCHLREFLWDLAVELVVRVRPSIPPPQPSWVHIRRRRPKRHIRTKEDLLEEVEKEAKIYLGVEERECRENLIIRWSRKRRDHVDEILVKESQEEEWEWTDYSEEENIIKNRIADAIIQESLTTATAAIAQAFVKKFND